MTNSRLPPDRLKSLAKLKYRYCMDWLYENAAHLHMSYEMLNMWIYVFGPLLSFAFLGLVNMGLTRAKR